MIQGTIFSTLPAEPENSLSIQYAGGFIGGDINFIKKLSANHHGISLRSGNSYWSVNAQAGRVEAFNSNSDVPIYQRFYVGGADTVRGYQYASQIGPANGGDLMAVGNVEYKFPIVQEKNHTVLQGLSFMILAEVGQRE